MLPRAREKILRIALRVRRNLSKSPFFPSNYCSVATQALVQELVAEGFNAEAVSSFYWCGLIRDLPKNGKPSDPYMAQHCWVEIDGDWVLDITADQFNARCKSRVAEVVLERYKDLPRHLRDMRYNGLK